MLCIIHETIDYISYILYIPFSMPYILYIYIWQRKQISGEKMSYGLFKILFLKTGYSENVR